MMMRFNPKLLTIGSLLLASSAHAGGPGFDNIVLNSGTTGSLSDCPTGNSDDCTPLIEGAGFLQQEVTFEPTSYIQTVIIDPMAPQTVTPIVLPPDTTFTQMAGPADGIVSMPPPPDQNDVMVSWLGQRVNLGGTGSSIFGFQSIDDINDTENAISTFSTALSTSSTTPPFEWDATNFGEPPSLGGMPTPAPQPRLVLDNPVVTITSEGPVTHIDPAILGGYTVYHQNDAGNIEVLLSEEATSGAAPFGTFLPGAHYLSWVVPAQNGLNKALFATQALHIQPLISFGPAAVISAGKGSTVTLPLFLNGEAPTYPVTVEYSVSGTAAYPEDHNATNGVVTIDSGNKGSITVNIASDATTNLWPAEELIFTLHSPQNAGLGKQRSQRVRISELHLPPQLDLLVLQQDRETRHVHHTDNAGTNVSAVIDINANNASSRYQLDWRNTDNLLLSQSTASDFTLQFDPNDIPPGRYQISVEVTDLNAPWLERYNVTKLINIIGSNAATAQPLQPAALTQPTYVHSMQHGVSINWPHSESDIGTFPLPNHLYEDSLLWPAGLKVTSGDTSTAIKKAGNYITTDDLAAHGGPNGEQALYPVDDELIPSQIVDFEISGLTALGQSVSIVIPQENPIPASPIYRKYMPHAGWVTFTEDSKNSLASTSKVNGICPGPEDSAYVSGLTAGDDCIRLTIEDGGPNDADQQANSIIKDPGGVSTQTTTIAASDTSDGDSGGGGAGFNLLWLLFALTIVRTYHYTKKTYL